MPTAMHTRSAAISVPSAELAGDQRGRLALEEEGDAARLEGALQEVACGAVELPLHQPRRKVNDRHVHAAALEAVRGLEPQQAAANHHRTTAFRGGVDHRLRVGDIAIRDHARKITTGNR
jgi:hypothetical protein